jgi:hypothetical protein
MVSEHPLNIIKTYIVPNINNATISSLENNLKSMFFDPFNIINTSLNRTKFYDIFL